MDTTEQRLRARIVESLQRVHRGMRHYPDLGDSPVSADLAQAAALKIANGLRDRDELMADAAEFRELRTPTSSYTAGAIDALLSQLTDVLTVMTAELDMATMDLDPAA